MNLMNEDLNSVTEEIKQEILDYVSSQYGEDIKEPLTCEWFDDNIDDIKLESYQIAESFLRDNFEIDEKSFDDYISEIMASIDIEDLIFNIASTKPMTFEEQLREIGMSVRDFI